LFRQASKFLQEYSIEFLAQIETIDK